MRKVRSNVFCGSENPLHWGSNLFGGQNLELVDPIVADPVAQDNDKRNNIQIYAEIPY